MKRKISPEENVNKKHRPNDSRPTTHDDGFTNADDGNVTVTDYSDTIGRLINNVKMFSEPSESSKKTINKYIFEGLCLLPLADGAFFESLTSLNEEDKKLLVSNPTVNAELFSSWKYALDAKLNPQEDSDTESEDSSLDHANEGRPGFIKFIQLNHIHGLFGKENFNKDIMPKVNIFKENKPQNYQEEIANQLNVLKS